jgi:phosphate uptake regulator
LIPIFKHEDNTYGRYRYTQHRRSCELKTILFRAGIQVEEMLQTTLDALFLFNKEKQEKAIKRYDKIVNLQMDIENKALTLIS